MRKRINAQFVCDLCQFCLLEVEDQSHLLWKCTLSKKIWQAVLAWWGLADKVNIENLESMWRSRKIFSIKILRKIWELVLAATIWSIWLARNDKIFNGKEAVTPVLLQMIKFRSLSWGIAYGIILQSKSAWWSENPSGVVTASLRSKWFNIMLEEQCSITAFIDGSWNKSMVNLKGGIGGLVKSGNGDHILEFAGPTSARSAFQTELQALIQLLVLIVNSKWKTHKLLILTDSSQLVEFTKSQFISLEWEKLKGRVICRHINRVFNSHADQLAKQGVFCSKLWIKWSP